MDELLLFVLLATLVQFLVDRIKTLIPYENIGKIALAPWYSVIVGIGLAFVVQLDFLASLGLNTISTIGYIVTGLVISAGSAAVHELISKLRESRTPAATLTSIEAVKDLDNLTLVDIDAIVDKLIARLRYEGMLGLGSGDKPGPTT